MDQEQIEQRLIKVEKIVIENNVFLKKMHSMQKMALIFRGAYWIIIILLGLGAFYFVKPFLGQLGAIYGIGGAGDVHNINNLFQQFKTTNT